MQVHQVPQGARGPQRPARAGLGIGLGLGLGLGLYFFLLRLDVGVYHGFERDRYVGPPDAALDAGERRGERAGG